MNFTRSHIVCLEFKHCISPQYPCMGVVMGTGCCLVWCGLAWGRHFVESREAGGFVWDRCWARAEPSTVQASAVECAAPAWPVLPCQCVQCVWVISDNIINYHKKSADQSPATGCGPVKTSLTWHGESLSRRTSRSCVTWGMSWWWAAQWVDPSYQISSPQLTQHLDSQTEKSSFSASWSHPGLVQTPKVIKCASDNKVPPTNGMCAELVIRSDS